MKMMDGMITVFDAGTLIAAKPHYDHRLVTGLAQTEHFPNR